MKYIYRLRKPLGYYYAYYGDNYEAIKNDNSLLDKGYKYEMEQYSTLELLWFTIHDHGVIPRNLIEKNKITAHGDFVTGKIINDHVLICLLPDWKKKKCFTIGIENLKKIWEKYIEFECKEADEIILQREGNHFSIHGIWFKKNDVE